jgi:penicillin amidase
MPRARWWIPGLLAALASCSSNNTPAADAGATADAGSTVDAATPTRREELPVAETLRLPRLDAPVDVVVDRWGWPHIRGSNLRDVARAQGYLLARDRMAQMDVLRRLSSGTLAERFGALNAGAVDSDITFRTIGLRRAAQAMWTQLEAAGPSRERTLLEGFAEGVNHYLAQVRRGSVSLPTGSSVVVDETTGDWSPVDSLVIGRYQSYSLSYDAGDDIRRSGTAQRIREVFDTADPMANPAFAARRGMTLDVLRWAPPTDAIVVPEFLATLGGATGQALTHRPEGQRPVVSRSVFRDADRFVALSRAGAEMLGDDTRGSNNWIVAPSGTRNGRALLANDPHLALNSPGIWWGTHLTVTDGPDAVDVAGTTFPGIPGVIIGFTPRVAWGVTTAGYDVTDVYQETVTPGTNGQPGTVRFNGMDVPLQIVTERIANGRGGFVDLRVEVVPHHGPIVPRISNGQVLPREGTAALSIKWTGHQPTTDLAAFIGVSYARNVTEARAAVQRFGVGAQNWVLADIEGNTAYTSHAVIPVRAMGALTWHPTMRPDGTNPCMVLPGDGAAEWVGALRPEQIPQGAPTMARPYLATANGDQSGVTLDNNPFDAPVYLGCDFAYGYRQERILQRLAAVGPQATREDMESIQSDTHVLLGGQLRPFLMEAMARMEMAWANPSSQPDLAALAAATMPRQARIRDAAMRLQAWSLDGASGVGEATAQQRRDATATSVFHGWVVRLLANTFNDEQTALNMPGASVGWDRVRGIVHLLRNPGQLQARDPATMQSALWDDLSTSTVTETRDLILVRSLDEALTELERLFATPDLDMWRWGEQHTVRFAVLFPPLGPGVSIPASGGMFPRGFPRPGGIDVVDASGPSTGSFNFSFGSGASQRLTVEMDPSGPRGFNALPGGQSIDPESPHHRDEAELWRTNRSHQVHLREADIVANHTRRIRIEQGM